MYSLNAGNWEELLRNFLIFDAQWCSLHEDVESVLEDLDGGGEDEETEDKGADGIDDDPGGLEVDDDGGHEDTEGLEKVADYVDESSFHVDVFLIFVMDIITRLYSAFRLGIK